MGREPGTHATCRYTAVALTGVCLRKRDTRASVHSSTDTYWIEIFCAAYYPTVKNLQAQAIRASAFFLLQPPRALLRTRRHPTLGRPLPPPLLPRVERRYFIARRENPSGVGQLGSRDQPQSFSLPPRRAQAPVPSASPPSSAALLWLPGHFYCLRVTPVQLRSFFRGQIT